MAHCSSDSPSWCTKQGSDSDSNDREQAQLETKVRINGHQREIHTREGGAGANELKKFVTASPYYPQSDERDSKEKHEGEVDAKVEHDGIVEIPGVLVHELVPTGRAGEAVAAEGPIQLFLERGPPEKRRRQRSS
jgi:hypothetical protein